MFSQEKFEGHKYLVAQSIEPAANKIRIPCTWFKLQNLLN